MLSKCPLLGVILLGVLLWYTSYVQINSLLKSLPRKLDSNRTVSESHHMATNDVPIYTEELAKLAVRPSSWQCVASDDEDPKRGATNDDTVFAFIHVFKTAGSTMRKFFHQLAYTCHKTWVSLAKCTGVLPSSIQSRGPWKPCMIEEVADGRGRKKAYVNRGGDRPGTISNPRVEKFIDIFGGHMRLGTADSIFPDSPTSTGVRYILFLRDPLERYVSGVLYQNMVKGRGENLEQVATKIKKRIVDARKNDQYWDKSLSYLLTPVQRVTGDKKSNNTLSSMVAPPSSQAKARALVAIQNLQTYNVIIGMTERMPESLTVLRHVFLKNSPENSLKDEAEAVFKKFGLVAAPHTDGAGNHSAPSVSKGGVHQNQSKKKHVSTSAVIAELVKDKEFLILMEEYVKYERMITNFAWTMHNLQYDSVMRGTIDNLQE